MSRRIKRVLYKQQPVLGADAVVADLTAITLGERGYLGLRCVIAKLDGGAPTDAPQGTWELHIGDDESGYDKYDKADTELAAIKPNGNAVVKAYASLSGIPAEKVKVRYKIGSGGAGGTSLVTLVAYVDE